MCVVLLLPAPLLGKQYSERNNQDFSGPIQSPPDTLCDDSNRPRQYVSHATLPQIRISKGTDKPQVWGWGAGIPHFGWPRRAICPPLSHIPYEQDQLR